MQRREGILKDHLHQLGGLRARKGGANGRAGGSGSRATVRRSIRAREQAAIQQHLPRAGGQQSHHHAGQGGLAAAAFAHQPQGAAPVQGQRHAVHGAQHGGRGVEHAPAHGEVAADAAQFQKRCYGESPVLMKNV
ncbi:hypothetical protein DSECCO2_627580 [anaerobic digester metagenome]